MEGVDEITKVKVSLQESIFELLTEEDDYKIIREGAIVFLEFNKIEINTAHLISIAVIDQEGEEKRLDINGKSMFFSRNYYNNNLIYFLISERGKNR